MRCRCSNGLMLNGVVANRAVYSQQYDNYRMVWPDDPLYSKVPEDQRVIRIGTEHSLKLEFVLHKLSDTARFLERISPGSTRNFVVLGSGWVCQFCGDYTPAGSLFCINCGGGIEIEPFSAVRNFPLFVTDYNLNQNVAGDIELEVNFVFYEYREQSFLITLGNNICTLPYSYTLQEHLYVCQYCGRTVESGQKCSGCGGGRLPLSEVVKMENTCLACGGKVIGGVVCQSCGMTLKATAYRELGGGE